MLYLLILHVLDSIEQEIFHPQNFVLDVWLMTNKTKIKIIYKIFSFSESLLCCLQHEFVLLWSRKFFITTNLEWENLLKISRWNSEDVNGSLWVKVQIYI